MTTPDHTADMPYPNNAIAARIDRVERRQDNTDVTVSGLLATTAVHTAEIANHKTDIQELSKRLDRILTALWGLVLVLIPVAVSMVAAAIE